MAKISIDGHSYSGNTIRIENGTVIVDGQDIGEATGKVHLIIEGVIENLTTDASIAMTGTINGDVTAGGSISCDDVGGSLVAGGSVNCDAVGGDVKASGSVNHG